MTTKKNEKNAATINVVENETPLIYANQVNISSSVFDVNFDFGIMMRSGENEFNLKKTACVVMSPQHAKALLEVLSDHIAKYETNFGELPKLKEE